MSMGEVVPPIPHEVDGSRLKVLDEDRYGSWYTAWCTCGKRIATNAPDWRAVVEALGEHRAKERRIG